MRTTYPLSLLPCFLILLFFLGVKPSSAKAQQQSMTTRARVTSRLPPSASTAVPLSSTTSIRSTPSAASQRKTLTAATPQPTPSNLAASNETSTTTPHNQPRLDATFGVLGRVRPGALLLLSGVPLAGWGIQNKWSSVFIVGGYTGAFIVGLITLHFGVVGALHPPRSITRGLYLLASLLSGLLVGGFAVIWWRGSRHLCSAFGGFSIGLYLLCLKSDGLIHPIGMRYILLVGCAALGFILSTITKLLPFVMIMGTAALGSTAVILGIDCFTLSSLKEFYVYNLGFTGLFPSHPNSFPITLGIEIELGALAAVFLCSVAWQFRAHKTAPKTTVVAPDNESIESPQRSPNSSPLTAWEEKYGSASSPTTTIVPSPTSATSPKISRERTTSGTSLNYLPKISISDFGESRPLREPSSPGVSQWDAYLAERKIAISPPPSASAKALARRTMSHPVLSLSNGRVLDTIESEDGHTTIMNKVEEDDDDDTPLGKITPTSSASGTPTRTISGSGRPISLALPLTPPSALKIDISSRRKTMIDLREGEKVPANAKQEERILVGDWKKKVAQGQTEQAPVRPPRARVMSCEQLDEKHRRRLSQLQAPATENVVTAAELQDVKTKYDSQRRRDRENSQRSLTSLADKRISKRLSNVTNFTSLPTKRHSTVGNLSQNQIGNEVGQLREAQRRKSTGALKELQQNSSRENTLKEDMRFSVASQGQSGAKVNTLPAKKHDWLGY